MDITKTNILKNFYSILNLESKNNQCYCNKENKWFNIIKNSNKNNNLMIAPLQIIITITIIAVLSTIKLSKQSQAPLFPINIIYLIIILIEWLQNTLELCLLQYLMIIKTWTLLILYHSHNGNSITHYLLMEMI